MAALLSASDLRAGYGAGDVLQGVSVEVGQGEIVAVLGRNGVGKSTLMKALIGLLALRGGKIVLSGEDLTRRIGGSAGETRRRIRAAGPRDLPAHDGRRQSADGTLYPLGQGRR